MNNTSGSTWHKWDLHLHSTASDGKCTPQELVDLAKKNGISVIALTDHHTVNNLNETKQLGSENGITVISGIEFRTEYGQKSVHMIGLFPDCFGDIRLDESALNDLILSPLNLSRTHIIAAALKDDPSISNDDVAYKKGLLKVQVDFKKAADLIHKYGGLVSVHAGNKQNSFESEMRHEGKGPRNVDLADSLGPVKEELLEKYIDICEVRNPSESSFYINKWKKPAIAASDTHNREDFARNYVWIKGEPSFEGLKQILYEPKTRVCIQEDEPEYKNDYFVIESLSIDHPDFGKQKIPFNSGLNTIIGGRSSGKSILLGAIAKLCGNTTPIKEEKPGYDSYIEQIAHAASLEWRDHICSETRKIDFFPQGHIIKLASDPSKISELVEKILRSNPTYDHEIKALKNFYDIQPGNIHGLFSEFKSKLYTYKTLKDELSSLGNKSGVDQEIHKIESRLKVLHGELQGKFSDENKLTFERTNALIEQRKKDKLSSEQRLKSLLEIQSTPIINDLDLSEYILTEAQNRSILQLFSNLKSKAQQAWYSEIQILIDTERSRIDSFNQEIQQASSNDEYCSIKNAYEKNKEYRQFVERLNTEKARLNLIQSKESEISKQFNEIQLLKKELVESNSLFYQRVAEYCGKIKLERGNISIVPKIAFNTSTYQNFITSNFDARTAAFSQLIEFSFNSKDHLSEFIEQLFQDLLSRKYNIKGGKNPLQIAEELLTLNLFRVNYNIIYQGDDLSTMSEGKVAFVILRILLDFSDANYPILIDQPEDDLDNRAIFHELVCYLRDKKQSRQIILVTHNPNIVVGADAEEIIVANQNGINTPNPNGTKFSYYSGALENSFTKDLPEILPSKGIREHVCEILEGGEQAFRVREHKYQI